MRLIDRVERLERSVGAVPHICRHVVRMPVLDPVEQRAFVPGTPSPGVKKK